MLTGGASGSVATSKLKDSQFNPEHGYGLCSASNVLFMSMWGSLVSSFIPKTHWYVLRLH